MKRQLEEIGRSTLLSSLWERFKKKKGKRDTIMNHASCLYHAKEIIFSTLPINTIDLCHKKQVAYIYIPLKGIILQSFLQYY